MRALLKTTVISSFLAMCVFSPPSFAQNDQAAGGGERQWLSIPQIYGKVEEAGYRDVRKIERERGYYEVKAIDRDGRRVELHVNPQTGEIKHSEWRGSRRGEYGGARAPNNQRYSADCNERRCRDDVPQSESAPQTAPN